MRDFKKALKNRIRSVIEDWHGKDVYAVSFLVNSNDSYKYNGFSNVVNFSVSYNTESDCPGAGAYDEERWNYAFWRQDEVPVIFTDKKNTLTDLLFEWYEECGIKNIGFESNDEYDENCNYIGKGPVGHYEFLSLISDIAAELQKECFIADKFGRKLPIIIHGFEYSWYDIEATERGNPDGEAGEFLRACKELGFTN